MNVDDLISGIQNLSISTKKSTERTMDLDAVQTMLNTAIRQATDQVRQNFEDKIDDLTQRLAILETPVRVEEYKPIEIRSGIECNESLDIIKSIPEFNGDAAKYVSWRQAAITAHTLYENFEGSSKYYQAVAIIRNKVVGVADTVLSSYNTVLNFKAIISRLDFSYGDKRSIYTLEQELSTLRQDSRSIVDFYDEVERKLTLIINKVIMMNEGKPSLIEALNRKYRDDALRVFISGLRRPMSDVLFSCKPTDMPSALALSQELETNQIRYNFASTFANHSIRNTFQNSPHYQPIHRAPFQQFSHPSHYQYRQNQPDFSNGHQPNINSRFESPPYSLNPNRNTNIANPSQNMFRPTVNRNSGRMQQFGYNYHQHPEPMEIDMSDRLAQKYSKRPANSFRHNTAKAQRVNHLSQCYSYPEYFCEDSFEHELKDDQTRALQVNASQDDSYNCNVEDDINFLEVGPSSRI